LQSHNDYTGSGSKVNTGIPGSEFVFEIPFEAKIIDYVKFIL